MKWILHSRINQRCHQYLPGIVLSLASTTSRPRLPHWRFLFLPQQLHWLRHRWQSDWGTIETNHYSLLEVRMKGVASLTRRAPKMSILRTIYYYLEVHTKRVASLTRRAPKMSTLQGIYYYFCSASMDISLQNVGDVQDVCWQHDDVGACHIQPWL